MYFALVTVDACRAASCACRATTWPARSEADTENAASVTALESPTTSVAVIFTIPATEPAVAGVVITPLYSLSVAFQARAVLTVPRRSVVLIVASSTTFPNTSVAVAVKFTSELRLATAGTDTETLYAGPATPFR